MAVVAQVVVQRRLVKRRRALPARPEEAAEGDVAKKSGRGKGRRGG